MRTAVVVALALAACGEVRPPRKPGILPDPAPGGSWELVPGVVVDRDGRTIYAATGDGRIVAVDVASGTERWTSGEAVRPLLVTPLGLLAQRDAEGALERMDLALVDVRTGGLASGCEPVRLASWVRADLAPADDLAFVVRARWSVEGRPVVEWRARAKVKIPGVEPKKPRVESLRPDPSVETLPEASGWALLDPGACGVLELGPELPPHAAPFEPPTTEPVRHGAITAQVVLAPGPGERGVVAALRRRQGSEGLPDVPLAADPVEVDPVIVWSAERGHTSIAAPEPGNPGSGLRWVVVGVDDGERLLSTLVPAAPTGFAVTPAAIVAVFPDALEGFDRGGASLWVRDLRTSTPPR